MEEPESFSIDSEDVREQIEQQRALAAQLREKLEHDELQLASKEQQNELLKSKLSLLKSRTKSKRNASSTEKDDKKIKNIKDQSGSSPKQSDSKYTPRKQPGNSVNKGKINILREQLEQNRLRFERHGLELSEDTRSMEAMVEQLRHELEERDVTIQQLQEGQETPVLSSYVEQNLEPMDVNTQLLQKEQEVRNLTNQVSDLHNTILELQENLKEKDCVIEARTQAISLLSEDMSKKWRANVDMLEETRQQMQMMQENFIRIEAGLNAEIEQLSLQLQNNAEKLSHVESNLRATEAARNDLASHNAELLTELDVLKAAPKASQGLEEAKLKVNELTQALSEANKLTVKLKAEHKAKVKALNKQIDSLRKESDLSGELVHLQNRIAELEEEKAAQEQTAGQLLEALAELHSQKNMSAMVLGELKGQLSLKDVLEQELSELKLKLEDRENEIQSLRESLGNAQRSPCPDQLSDLEKELAEARISLKEWQCRYEDLENQLAEKVTEVRAENVVCGEQTVGQNFTSDKQTAFKENLEEKVRYLEESMREKRIQVQELETLIQNSLEKIEIISSQGDCTNCLTFKQQVLDQDTQIKSLEASIDALKEENETLRVEINGAGNLTNVEAPVALQSAKPQNPVNALEDITDLQRQLIEASGELELKREECARLEGKLKAQIEKSKKIAINLKVKTLANKDLEERISKYETLVQSNKTEVEGLMKEKQDLIEKWQMETSEKDATLRQTAENLALRELDIQNLSQQLVDKSSAVDELQAALASLQARTSELQLIVEEKSAAIERLNIDNAEHHQQVESEKLSELQREVVTLRNQILSESEEKQAAILKLENFTKQAKLKLAKEKKVRSELLEKQNELEALLTEKNSAVAVLHEQHAMALQSAQLEKEAVQVSLGEQQEQIYLLRQQLEQERSKLQYASENVNAEEAVEMTEELQVIPSVESFQTEIDDMCLSFNGSSPQDVLPILEDEKTKTMDELRTSFESLHCQIIERLHNRPDVHGDRKLFAELRNLITRVMNRTAALESKIKQIVAESDSILHNKLHEAERSIQSLENSLSEAKNYIELKDKEKVNLEETVNKIDQERWTLCQQIQEKTKNYFDLEVKLKEMNDETSTLLQTRSSLQEQLQEKETFVQNLQSKLQSSVLHSEQLQQEINNLHQHNNDLRIDLERAHEECEALKLKYLTAEKDINTANVSVVELKAAYEDAVKKGESLQQQVDESTQYYSEMHNQLQNSSQEIAELQQQLERTTQTTSQLKEEVCAISNVHSQQSASWENEKEQFEKRISDLTQELQGAIAQASKDATHLSPQTENGEVEEQLRQQLAEKTAELENYQRRLIQLQMGAPGVLDVPLFNFSSNENQAFQEQEKVAIQQEVYQVHTSNSDSVLDAFKPAASFFEKTPEVDNLHIKIQSLTEQLNALQSEKDALEVEKCHLRANLETLREELNISQADLQATQPTIEDLKLKVSELTATLQATEVCIEEERNSASKLQGKIEALQWKLENEKYEKETAENELKVQAQKQAEERPDIPQSLDTHVSSLQDSGSGFNRTEKQDSFDGQKADETLMESNMTLLESELRGMVMSHLDGNLKQDAESGGKENTDTLFSHVKELKIKLSQLETEKKNALSEIDVLRAQIEALSQSSTEIVSSTSQTESGVNDSLMNEDDSWGWGAESAHLEVQHQQQKSQSVTVPDDFVKELQEQIDSLKVENEKLEKDKLQAAEDLKASQIRAAKLTRKLRDLKSKYDEITGKSRSTDSPFDSLDQAIEEERMKQMQGLEKELKDMQTEFNTLKADRDRLQKQVDVLSSANERMVEAKERQDVEVEMWQKRSKDLTTQVQALEWKISELEDGKEESTTEFSKVPESSPSVTQPTETLNAVEIDQLLKENHTWNANYENLMQEYQKLRAQCLADSEQRTQIDALVAQQKGMIERLEHEKTYFQDVYDSLKMDYESACAQLASIQTTQSEDGQFVQKAEELEIKLRSAEGQLQESISQLQMVTSDNADLQARCSHLTNERESLVKQLDEGQSRLEITALEMSRLQENIRVLEEKSAPVQPEPIHEVFVTQEASAQSSAPGSSVFTWGSVVSGAEGDQPAGDIFDSIASSTAQGLEEQLAMKDSEMQKDKRMIETLKRTMAESEQEWNQIIEYHKSQLESAKQTISDLQSEVESLKQFASGTVEVVNREDDYNEQREKYQEMQTLVFTKEKELENLQINLAVSEETKRKLEAELQSKKAEVDRLLSEIPQNSRESAPQSVQVSGPDVQVASGYGSGTLPISSMSIPPESSVNKNLSNELDLALYMLHERDVRCEELTLELTQLLEERDGLQLRLSNAIRTNEELRERLKQLLTTQSTQSADVNNSSILLQGQFPVVSSIPLESSQNVASEGYTVDLQNKLTELRKMGYNHDKSLKEDSEYRHQQQMRLLSPSPTTVMSANTAELTVTSETALEPASETIPIVPNPDPNNVDQSSSNESQGLLGWFWGRS